jgi:hypothetical protein
MAAFSVNFSESDSTKSSGENAIHESVAILCTPTLLIWAGKSDQIDSSREKAVSDRVG